MKKNYNVSIEDNGATFLIVINKGTNDRFVIAAFNTLGDAWRHIEWLYKIESQEFIVSTGSVNIPVKEWIECMRSIGYLE